MSVPFIDGVCWGAGMAVKSHTVLCVDDEPKILNSLRRLLRRESYATMFADSGERALAMIAEHDVDLVLSDHLMPRMTGAELVTTIKKNDPQIPCILLSGYADIAVIMALLRDGRFYRVLHKPWDDGELKCAIEQCLNICRSLRNNLERMSRLFCDSEHARYLGDSLNRMVNTQTAAMPIVRETLQTLPLPAFAVDSTGTIVAVNEATYRILDDGIVVGCPVRDTFPADVVACIESCSGRLVPNSRFQIRGRWVELQPSVVANEDVHGWVVVVKEVGQ